MLRTATRQGLKHVSASALSLSLPQRRDYKVQHTFRHDLWSRQDLERVNSNCKIHKLPEIFACNVFSDRVMSQMLPQTLYKRYKQCLQEARPVDCETVEAIANAAKEWAINRGATHYSHWFQPLTGKPVEKHDGFLTRQQNSGDIIMKFSGDQLARSETDGSSFPSGGLRETSAARGYTLWDTSASMFIMETGGVPTLYVPTLFFSWNGEALDHKIPLLRSQEAIKREALRLCKVIGDGRHTSIKTDSGVEQEFFLIDREFYHERPDLEASGRTVIGLPPPKGQVLADQYFGPLSDRMMRCVHEMEVELWKLGIPVTTRHKEVAPNQYEICPIFENSTVASDHNLLMTEIMQRVAFRHGLVSLFHEKPFAHVNGSGKHNNWSLGSPEVPTFLDPGPTPSKNKLFLTFMAAVIKAVDEHADLIRFAVSGPGNDLRLGGHEAPPPVISVFLGDEIQGIVDEVVHGIPPQDIEAKIDLGVPYLPVFKRHKTDRNRTSPFAFTGNKFELRAVGASQSPSLSNMVLNAIVADAIHTIASEIEAQRAASPSDSIDDATFTVVRRVLSQHARVLFNGDNYSTEWKQEASRRGLPIFEDSTASLDALTTPKNIALFEQFSILTRAEIEARQSVGFYQYAKNLLIEASCLLTLARNAVLPASIKYQHAIAESICKTQSALSSEAVLTSQRQHLSSISSHINALIELSNQLEKEFAIANAVPGDRDPAFQCRERIVPLMKEVRSKCDTLERFVDGELWPLPTYHQMLHNTA